MLQVVGCMLYVTCCMSHVACCMLCAAWLHVVACRSVACSACRATAAEVRRAAAAVEVLHVAMPIAAVKHRHLGIAATPVARRPPAARQRRGRAPLVEDVVAPMPKGLVASAVGDKGGLVRDDPACACVPPCAQDSLRKPEPAAVRSAVCRPEPSAVRHDAAAAVSFSACACVRAQR